MLNIRLMVTLSPEGTLNLLHKAKGQKKAVQAVWAEMKKMDIRVAAWSLATVVTQKYVAQFKQLFMGEFPRCGCI